MLAVPARASQRLPHLSNHDVHEIEQEVIAALFEVVATEKILLDQERVARESAEPKQEENRI
jgi:phage terminase Nu1 subunit (DNA packaging protein)